MWLLLSSATSRAPRMPAASSRPCWNSCIWSPRLCSTSVGRSSSAIRALESVTWRCDRASTAVSASTAIRCRSSSQRICSSVPPGIIMLVKTRRNSDVGRAQPTLISASNAA